MLDFYAFKLNQVPGLDPETKDVLEAERKIEKDLGCSNCSFHFDRHEFEAILFTDPDQFIQFDQADPKTSDRIKAIREKYPNPEDINTGFDSCPSRRLISIIPSYRKIIDGQRIYAQLDINAVRAQCPHFDRWITALCRLKD